MKMPASCVKGENRFRIHGPLLQESGAKICRVLYYYFVLLCIFCMILCEFIPLLLFLSFLLIEWYIIILSQEMNQYAF